MQFFKNYKSAEVTFCNHFNCLVGLNGSGKTNILDAIHYLSSTRSAFHALDTQSINQGSSFFVINGEISSANKINKVHCSLKKNSRKTFKVNDSEYEKLSQHVGKFPVVLIAPNDDELIRESNEVRRKFFDSIISQYDAEYLRLLISYNQLLKQRNALLKSLSEADKVNHMMLESYDVPMMKMSIDIANKRLDFIEQFEPFFQANYDLIAEKKENVSITYQTKVLDENYSEQFSFGLQKDIITQRTNLGIHRDAYLFEIDDLPIKKYGSQGQQKSSLISLKLAQFEFVKKRLNITPLLLLDDIFDKLDDRRIQKLMSIIGSERFGQVFLTDAREERTKNLLANNFDSIRIFRIEDNKIHQID